MFALQNPSCHLKQVVVGAMGMLIVSLTAQAQIFSGQISFVGGANIDNAVPNATTFTSFIGPSGSGDPVVQGGMESGAYGSVPGGTDVAFTAPFTFSPAPVSPFQLWTFTINNTTTYSFDVTSVTTDSQQIFGGSIAFLNVGGDGLAYITGYAATPATWSITGTSANSAAVTITIGSAINAVPEPSTVSLMVAGLLICGAVFRQHLKRTSQLQRSVVKA